MLPSTVPAFAGPLLHALTTRLPKVRLRLTEGSSVQLEDWLNQGRLDLSLRPTIPFKEVVALPLVLPGEPHMLRSRLNTLAKQHQIKLNIAMEVDSVHRSADQLHIYQERSCTRSARAIPQHFSTLYERCWARHRDDHEPESTD